MSIAQLYKACRAAEAVLTELADPDELSNHDGSESSACGGPNTCVLCQVREAIINAQEEDLGWWDEKIPMARLHPIDE